MKYLSDEVALSVFEEHIDFLSFQYDMVSLSDVIEYSINGSSLREKPVCHISFDDGLASVYHQGFPILAKRNIPVSVFLNTSVVGNGRLLWQHFLNYMVYHYGISSLESKISEILGGEKLRFRSAIEMLIWFKRQYASVFYDINILDELSFAYGLEPSVIAKQQSLYLDWCQVEEMRDFGMSFYSHTTNHAPLRYLSKASQYQIEIDQARIDLVEKDPELGRFLSFPFGMLTDYGTDAKKYALEAGHEYVVEVGDGLNPTARINNERILARVGLGSVSSNRLALYFAIEVRPFIKYQIRNMTVS